MHGAIASQNCLFIISAGPIAAFFGKIDTRNLTLSALEGAFLPYTVINFMVVLVCLNVYRMVVHYRASIGLLITHISECHFCLQHPLTLRLNLLIQRLSLA